MLNIQFMTDANAIRAKDEWTGNEIKLYVPNFDELARNASCAEELEAIEEIRQRIKAGRFKGFRFEIVYMSYEKGLAYNRETKKQEWEMKWQMLQHPWYRSGNGVYATKEEMVRKIEEIYTERAE